MTMQRSPLIGRLAMGIAAVALLAAFSVPVATSALTCREARVAAAPVQATSDVLESRGLDLEVRILNVRIEFPWLKTLPISPGRRIVISWLTDSAD